MNPISLTHFFTHFRSLGGVQSLLHRHLETDASFGLDSNVVAFFDPAGSAEKGRVQGLGMSWRTTVRGARNSFRDELPREARRPFSVYNNFWGLPFLADLDGAQRRIAVLHSYHEPVLGKCLEAVDGLVDGVLCVSEPLCETVRRFLPSLGGDRVAILPLPIRAGPVAPNQGPLRQRPFVLGFTARLVNEQKRVDRLPAVVRALEAAGVDFRLELLGSGPREAWLRRQFANSPRVRFHGHLRGDDYWKVVAGWDGILFTSDFEGLPLSLLEAMSMGVLPIFPKIQSGGDDYVTRLNPRFLFDLQDLKHVAEIISRVAQAGESQVVEWRSRCRQLAEPHLGDNYDRTFANFVREIMEAPKVSAAKFPARRPFLTDHFPFGLLVRASIRGFYRRNDG